MIKYINQIFIYTCFNFVYFTAHSQIDSLNYPYTANVSRISYPRLALVSGTYLGTMATIHIYELNAWWKNYRKPFHFREDLKYGLNVDKIGHVWGGNILTFVSAKSLEWSGMNEQSSLYYGAVSGSVFQLFVEFQDGFSLWGFDRVDAAADIVGAWYPVLQYHVPFFQSMNFKASYYPRKLNEAGNISGQKHIIIDDYEGQTFWLSLNTTKLFPLQKNIFPSFFSLAIGYSVRGTESPDKQYPVALVGLDFDFKEIIPQDNWTGRAVAQLLNFYRFPLPALQIYPSVMLHGLYF
ncbi:MAG: DUF2279 domain-containing protein [Ignavibacteria bacterium]|nr:DUF2279 domain-containing protein [Ignavibacteria bacterium]